MNPLRRSLSILGLALVFAVVLRASPAYAPAHFTDTERRARLEAILPELDALFQRHAAEKHIPGSIYGVVLDGELVHVATSGMAELSSARGVTRDTRFRIASMTKSFTALAILMLRDAGKLSLDDPIEKHIPRFAAVARLTEDSPPVTIGLLLRMGGGFPQDDPWGDRRLADSVAEFESLVSGGLNYSTPPGTGYEYSNLGYTLLGHIVTRVAGEPYQSYITREILQPLGMKHTVWEFTTVPPDHLALGYRWEHDRHQPEPILHDGAFGAMGGLISTIDDFARYVAFHLDAWPPRDGASSGPASRATRREMHRMSELAALVASNKTGTGQANPRVVGYGFGLNVNLDARGVSWVRHAGGLPGYGSEYRFLPEHGVALIAFANLTYAPMTAVNTEAMELLIEKAKLPPRKLPASPILRRRAAQLAGIIQDWRHPDAADALAPNFFLDRSSEDWAAESSAHLGKLGRRTAVTEVSPLNQLRGTFSITGEHGRIDVFFTLMPEATPRVQALTLSFVPTEPPPAQK